MSVASPRWRVRFASIFLWIVAPAEEDTPASGKNEAYAIADPSTVAIEGTSNDVMSFTCGDQQPRRVRVGFIPKPDVELQTAGEVMRIEFR